MRKIHLILRVRPLSWFFRKDWYATRTLEYTDGEIGHVLDIGAITIGWREQK